MTVPDHQPGPNHPSGPVTLREGIDALMAAANDIRASTEAAVSAGFRTRPDPVLMRRVECIDAMIKLLAIVYPYWDRIAPLLRNGGAGFSR